MQPPANAPAPPAPAPAPAPPGGKAPDIRQIMGALQAAARDQGGGTAEEEGGEGGTDAMATQTNIRLHAAGGGRAPSGREPRGRAPALDFTLPNLITGWFDYWLRGEGRAFGDGRTEGELASQYVFSALWRDFQAQPDLPDGSPVYDVEAWVIEVFTAMLQPAADAAEGGTRREVRGATIRDCCEAGVQMAKQGMPAEEIFKRLPALLGGA